MSVSIIVPVYNEEENIVPLLEEIAPLNDVLDDLEVIFVDDGSTDKTWEHIQSCESKWPFFRGLRCEVNQGQTSAMLRGMRESKGERLVLLDGDLQNNPADIPKLLETLESCDAVCGYRAERKDTWSKRVGSRLANRVRNWVTKDGIRDTGCSLKAFHRKCVSDIPPLNGAHRFIPAYFSLHGRRIEELPVDHRPRQHGVSKYTNLSRLPATIGDLFGFRWYRKRIIKDLQSPETSG